MDNSKLTPKQQKDLVIKDCLAVHIHNSLHNNPATGYHFCLRINADITEVCFLPKCGLLHPYHDSLGYNIGCYPLINNPFLAEPYIDINSRSNHPQKSLPPQLLHSILYVSSDTLHCFHKKHPAAAAQ